MASEDTLPADLEITARDEDDHIMAFRHRRFNITGVQFHPESILTPYGETMMRNWLR
jgi:anthranilate synthase component 2